MNARSSSMNLAALTAAGAVLLLGLTACGGSSDSTSAPPLASKSFVLVHGAWQGAWAWNDEAAALRAKGATVTVVELPGHGDDATPLPEDTLESYVAKTAEAIDASPSNVVLVGHSIAGAVITGAVEARPSRIDKLVYLSAYVFQDGQTIADLAHTDAASHIGGAITEDAEHGIASFPKDKLADIFCADCSADKVNELIAHYRDEPLAPFITPVHLTPANWGRASKYYVFTKEDHAVSYDLQQKMTAGVTWAGTTTLDTSHSPFLSAPDALANALTDIATR